VLSAVIDPNVLISAAISGKGAPAALLAASLQRKAQLVVSPKLLDELEHVLLRPRFLDIFQRMQRGFTSREFAPSRLSLQTHPRSPV
jgi:putative PIN family toxin of toxin-antitoxin system